MLLIMVILTMEKGKEVEKAKEVEVAVAIEVASMTIMGVVVNIIRTRDPLVMAMGVRTMAIMETRIITTMETRTSANHHTNHLNLSSRTNNSGNSNKDLVNNLTGVEATAGTVVVATMVGVTGEVATGAWVCLTISTARDTGRLNVPHNSGVRSAMDLT